MNALEIDSCQDLKWDPQKAFLEYQVFNLLGDASSLQESWETALGLLSCFLQFQSTDLGDKFAGDHLFAPLSWALFDRMSRGLLPAFDSSEEFCDFLWLYCENWYSSFSAQFAGREQEDPHEASRAWA